MKQLPHKIFVLFSTNVIPITHSNNWGQFLATPKWGDLSADPEKNKLQIIRIERSSKNIYGSGLGSFRHGSRRQA